MMKALFWMILIPSAWHLFSRLYYDIFFYGFPTDTADVLWMVFYYVSDIVTFFIGYFGSVLILNSLYAKEEKKREKYRKAFDSAPLN